MTLGQLLQSKRVESGRSLEQVAASTKIHIKILDAIESDHYSDLPARAFTRGFIVNYAKALKLDPDQILKDYHAFLEQKFNERPNRDQGHQGYAFEGKELEQNRRWIVIGVSVAVTFAVAVLLVFKPQNHKQKEKHKEFEDDNAQTTDEVPDVSAVMPPNLTVTTSPNSSTAPSTPASSPTPTATPAPTGTPAESPTPAAKTDKLNKGDDLAPTDVKRRVIFEAKEDVVFRYRSDKKPVSGLILRKGRFLVVKAKDRLIFETNHPESVSYKLKNTYLPLSMGKGEITDAGIKVYEGSELGSNPLPETPAPPPSE